MQHLLLARFEYTVRATKETGMLQVCCGALHTMVRTQTGQVFSWGWNKYGQLGLGTMENQHLPQAVAVDGVVVEVACGWWHSLLMVTAAVQSAPGEVEQID